MMVWCGRDGEEEGFIILGRDFSAELILHGHPRVNGRDCG